jgi:nicotinamidase-related amidase
MLCFLAELTTTVWEEPPMAPQTIDPARTALLVMDYQQGIIGRVPDADALLARARDAIELVRGHGGTIGYVRVAFADGETPGGTMGKSMTPELRETLHADAPGTQIDERIAPQGGDIVVRKVRVGALSTTDLHEQLQAKGIDTLLLAGISTSGVVLSTVRDAHDRDYRLIVVSDLCRDFDPEVHDFLTQRVFPRQAEVIGSADLDGLLK